MADMGASYCQAAQSLLAAMEAYQQVSLNAMAIAQPQPQFMALPENVQLLVNYVTEFELSLQDIDALQARGVAHYDPNYFNGAHQFLREMQSNVNDPTYDPVFDIARVENYINLYNDGGFRVWEFVRNRELGLLMAIYQERYPQLFKKNELATIDYVTQLPAMLTLSIDVAPETWSSAAWAISIIPTIPGPQHHDVSRLAVGFGVEQPKCAIDLGAVLHQQNLNPSDFWRDGTYDVDLRANPSTAMTQPYEGTLMRFTFPA